MEPDYEPESPYLEPNELFYDIKPSSSDWFVSRDAVRIQHYLGVDGFWESVFTCCQIRQFSGDWRIQGWYADYRDLLEYAKKCYPTKSLVVVAARRIEGTEAPESLSEHWTLLGYDVADGWLTSALGSMHSIPTEEIFAEVHPATGLLPLEVALVLRDLADEESPEHAPFFVYEVWACPSRGLPPEEAH